MIKKAILSSIIAFSALFLLSSNELSAGHIPCSGGRTSSGLYDCEWDPVAKTNVCNNKGSEFNACGYNHAVNYCTTFIIVPESCAASATQCAAQNRLDGVTGSGCSAAPYCGDTDCNGGENCSTCPGDCESCPIGGAVCGNGVCESGEDGSSCAADCAVGGCSSGDPFFGKSNCGEVGRDPGSGDCGVGCLCCKVKAAISPDTCGGVGFSLNLAGPYTLNKIEMDVGTSKTLYCSFGASGSIKGARFSGVAPISIPSVGYKTPQPPGFGAGRPFYNTMTATDVGLGGVWCFGKMNDVFAPGDYEACSGFVQVESLARPWASTTGASWFVNGPITMIIPPTCVTDCNLINPSAAVAIANGSVLVGTGGQISPPDNWVATSTYEGLEQNYNFFESIRPSKADPPASTIAGVVIGNPFASGGTEVNGYYYYQANGDVTFKDLILINGRKVVLFIDGGDLIIEKPIQLGNINDDFFMVIVGKTPALTKGNITIHEDLTAALPTPVLEGFFVSDGSFTTPSKGNDPADDQPLRIRGSVVAHGGVNFNRDLGPILNQTIPAELVEYSPELILNYPTQLSQERFIWREEAP